MTIPRRVRIPLVLGHADGLCKLRTRALAVRQRDGDVHCVVARRNVAHYKRRRTIGLRKICINCNPRRTL